MGIMDLNQQDVFLDVSETLKLVLTFNGWKRGTWATEAMLQWSFIDDL